MAGDSKTISRKRKAPASQPKSRQRTKTEDSAVDSHLDETALDDKSKNDEAFLQEALPEKTTMEEMTGESQLIGANLSYQEPKVLMNPPQISQKEENYSLLPSTVVKIQNQQTLLENGNQSPAEECLSKMSKQSLSYCAICGAPLAIKALRPGIDSETGNQFLEWTAKTQGLPPWFYRKVFFSIYLKALEEDPDYIPIKDGDLEFVRKNHNDFCKLDDLRRLSIGLGSPSNVSGRLNASPLTLSDLAKLISVNIGNAKKEAIGSATNVQSDEISSDIPPTPKTTNATPSSVEEPKKVYGAIPMHESCHEIALRYIMSAKKCGSNSLMTMDGVTSWLDLYQNLKEHWSREQSGYILAHQYNHGYHGLAEFQGLEWRRDDKSKVFEAWPCDTTSTTAYLLSQLQPLPKEVPIFPPFVPHSLADLPIKPGSIQWEFIRETTLDLPNDLMVFVRARLNGLRNPPLECARNHLPEWWREVLLRGFVWLWDLDHEQCRIKDERVYDDGVKIRWDWERLVRQLAQENCFEAPGGLKNAPDGLRNRRRIWRCLDEMKEPGTRGSRV